MRNIFVTIGFCVIAVISCNTGRYHSREEDNTVDKTLDAGFVLNSRGDTGKDSGNLFKKDDGQTTDVGGSGTGGEAGTAGQVTAGSSGYSGVCPPAERVDVNGPFVPTHIENGGPNGSSWIFYPQKPLKDGCKHPIFNWGPGAAAGPAFFLDHLNHLASHGFVIISQMSSRTGADEIASLEWLMAQNDDAGSPFHQKLDTTKVVMGGYSLGALTTFTIADYAPLSLYILACGGSDGTSIGTQNIHAPAIILGGDTDFATPSFENDYEVIPTPVIFLIKEHTDYIDCARNNLGPWTAFMRWQLYGEEKWRPDFFEGGVYCTSPWTCKSKGW